MEGDVLTAKNVDEEGLDSHSKKLEDSTDLETARGTADSAAMELQFREGSVQGDQDSDEPYDVKKAKEKFDK
ncbi:hypothetical protein KIN20_008857 [Parelaphostrongylus tenuis]|uniref:Uncharacterized protein n=1 Tax=Parelaphostrongylus tenuis TaxID=148309 RepID=A0AAD5QJ85_PARTN|nr:hypothetical protein KIN20_008857 [Parelaphostrongylus tenuis]